MSETSQRGRRGGGAAAAVPPAADAAAGAPQQLRGWALDRALVLELVEPELPPRFVVKVGESWAWCADLDAALVLVWQALRSKAALPAQWTAADPDLAALLRRHWPELQRLPAGQWWPRGPELG